MLKKMGWSEGTGLGKRQQGQNGHLKMRMRREAKGIGLEKGESDHGKESASWSNATSQYDALLNNLSSAYKSKRDISKIEEKNKQRKLKHSTV